MAVNPDKSGNWHNALEPIGRSNDLGGEFFGGMRCIAFGPVQSENAASLCIIDQHRTCDGESGAMSTTTFNLRYRPVRLGWCIELGDFEGFRKIGRAHV